jgi:hypothetical protein
MINWIVALLTSFMALDFFFITVRLTLSEIHRAQAAKNPLWLNFIIAILMLILWGIAILALGVTTSVLFHLMIGV